MFFQFCLVFSYGFNLFLLLSISALIPFSFSFFVYSFKIILKLCDFLFFFSFSKLICNCFICNSLSGQLSLFLSYFLCFKDFYKYFLFLMKIFHFCFCLLSDSILVCSYTSFMLEYFLSMSFLTFFISMYLSFSSACSTIVALNLLPKILS